MTHSDGLVRWPPVDLADPRIRDGVARLAQGRQQALADGARHVGWKVGWNDQGVRARLGVSSGVVGYLTDRTLAHGTISLQGLVRPMPEIEVALTIGRTIDATGDDAAVMAAVTRAAAAVELLDVDPTDVTGAVAANVWHHAYVLGDWLPWDPEAIRAGRGRVVYDRRDLASASTGALLDALPSLLRFVADGARAIGGSLRAGDVVLTGNLLIRAVAATPGTSIEAELPGAGTVRADFF